MDNPLVTIKYKATDGSTIDIAVSAEVAEVIEETDRKVRSQGRQNRRRHSKMEFIDGLTDALAFNPPEDLVDQIIKKYDVETLYTALNELPETQRRRVCLYYFEGLTYRQIGEKEGVNQTSICSSVKTAIKKMKKHFPH